MLEFGVLGLVALTAVLFGLAWDRQGLLVGCLAVGALIGISVALTDDYRNFIVLSAAALLPFGFRALPRFRGWPWWAQAVAVLTVVLAGKAIAVMIGSALSGPA